MTISNYVRVRYHGDVPAGTAWEPYTLTYGEPIPYREPANCRHAATICRFCVEQWLTDYDVNFEAAYGPKLKAGRETSALPST
jgi:hypothetical protein